VTDDLLWKGLESRKPFDFTLCCGILYHIINYEDLLINIASVTKEAILLDTRISDSNEVILEPGGSGFDAIVKTREKRVPNFDKLVEIMNKLGYEVERLSIDIPTPLGLMGNDDYNENLRVCLLALKR